MQVGGEGGGSDRRWGRDKERAGACASCGACGQKARKAIELSTSGTCMCTLFTSVKPRNPSSDADRTCVHGYVPLRSRSSGTTSAAG